MGNSAEDCAGRFYLNKWKTSHPVKGLILQRVGSRQVGGQKECQENACAQKREQGVDDTWQWEHGGGKKIV